MADDELPSIFGSFSALKAVTQASEGPQPGEVLADATLSERLGTGLKGYWFRGDLRGEEIAVHVLRERVTEVGKTSFQSSMDTFVKALRGKSPPNVLKPLSLSADRASFTARLCRGGTLADVGREHPWSLGQRLVAVATVAEAIAALHDHEIAHGALSPAAVILDDDGSPWIAGSEGNNLLLGTPGDSADPNTFHTYASPEAKAGDALDPRSDIFSLGRILYFLLCGEHRLLPADDAQRLGELDSSPTGLVRIVRKCTRLEPADRYQSVRRFLEDLVAYQKHEEVGDALPGVEEKIVPGEPDPLLARFDPQRTEPVSAVVLTEAEVSAAPTPAMSEPVPRRSTGQESRRRGREEIAVAIGASLVVAGILVSFLGGETGMMLGPVMAFFGAGAVVLGLAGRLR